MPVRMPLRHAGEGRHPARRRTWAPASAGATSVVGTGEARRGTGEARRGTKRQRGRLSYFGGVFPSVGGRKLSIAQISVIPLPAVKAIRRPSG